MESDELEAIKEVFSQTVEALEAITDRLDALEARIDMISPETDLNS
jgi:BMFP domain-containing protein YqiC